MEGTEAQWKQPILRIVRWTLIVTGSLVGLFIILVIVVAVTDNGAEQSSVAAPPVEALPPPAPTRAPAEVDAPSPPAEAEPEPAPPPAAAPSLSTQSTEVLGLFRELYAFRNHGQFHRAGFSGGIRYQKWSDQLDVLVAEDGDAHATVLSELGYVAGELFTLATDYVDNGGCTADSYTRDMEVRFLKESGIEGNQCTGLQPIAERITDPTSRSESASDKKVPVDNPPEIVRHESGLLEQKHDSCTVVMGQTMDDLNAVVSFCGLFSPGYYEGAGADGILLNLWLTEQIARGLLADQLQARQIANDLISSWSTLSGDAYPAIRFYWGDVLIMSANGRDSGVKVKFEL